MAKFLIFVALIVAIYFLFFRKKVKHEVRDEPSLEMVECATCGTFVSKDEAIKKGNKYFCSTKCLGG